LIIREITATTFAFFDERRKIQWTSSPFRMGIKAIFTAKYLDLAFHPAFDTKL
jgi:hypothetical protein